MAEPEKEGNEFFYIDKDGKKQDAALHEKILAEGDNEAALEVTRNMLRRRGWSEERIKRAYGSS